MPNELMPLNYAIIKCFKDGEQHCAESVVEALKPDYDGYKLLTREDVEEALATAKENGLLDEVEYSLDHDNKLRVFFRITKFGRDMIEGYLE